MTRALVLVGVLGVAWLAIRWWERRRTVAGSLPPGLTLVTAEGCTLCQPALDALRRAGADTPIRVVDIEVAGIDGIRSVPTVVAVRHDGTVALQRSGTSAIRDAAALVAATA